MQTTRPLLFISYAKPDLERVLPYVEFLKRQGHDTWIDTQRIKPGQPWDVEIKRALNKSSFIIIFISNNSVDRRGYVQRELKFAIDKYQDKLVSDIYIIPVVLDKDAAIPEAVSQIQYVEAWSSTQFEAIHDSIAHQLSAIGAQTKAFQEHSGIRWVHTTFKEAWDGIPGYTLDLNLLTLHSDRFINIGEASSYISAVLIDEATQGRTAKFMQAPEIFNFGSDRSSRTNFYDAACSDPIITGRIMTITASIMVYAAGAAHPNTHFHTESFFLDPLVRIPSLKAIFLDPEAALASIQRITRADLLKPPPEDEPDHVAKNQNWVEQGTADWNCFQSFVLAERGIEFLFPPYQVDCYAAGSQTSFVGYEHLIEFMRQEFVSGLSLGSMFGDHPAWLRELLPAKQPTPPAVPLG